MFEKSCSAVHETWVMQHGKILTSFTILSPKNFDAHALWITSLFALSCFVFCHTSSIFHKFHDYVRGSPRPDIFPSPDKKWANLQPARAAVELCVWFCSKLLSLHFLLPSPLGQGLFLRCHGYCPYLVVMLTHLSCDVQRGLHTLIMEIVHLVEAPVIPDSRDSGFVLWHLG